MLHKLVIPIYFKSRDTYTLTWFTAITIVLILESRNQAKIRKDSESHQQKFRVTYPLEYS